MLFLSQSRFPVVPSVLAACLWLAGCMTPDKAVREADEAATAAATEVWRTQSGRSAMGILQIRPDGTWK